MYGSPVSSVPTSMTAHVLALEPHAARASRRNRSDGLGVVRELGQQELDRDALVELEVRRRDDHAHAALAEDALDPQLSRDDRAYLEHLRSIYDSRVVSSDCAPACRGLRSFDSEARPER